ncbi:isoleucine--tRNA ligase [Trifolium repens]|nr:isoleucine--tRNA ligase [Trifolium repens]
MCSGVWADWNNPYLTVDLEYEATQVADRTEFQYPEGHVSRSIYAIFRVASAPLMPSDLLQEFPTLCLAIWTTTPWTIPANADIWGFKAISKR